MYVAEIRIENFRCFGSGESRLTLALKAGLTALVGENDTGKTAVIDALRFVLGTRDQEYFKVQESDFHCPSGSAERCTEISIRCRFDGLTVRDKSAFAEYRRFFRQLLLSSDGSPRWRRIGSLSKQTKGMPPDL